MMRARLLGLCGLCPVAAMLATILSEYSMPVPALAAVAQAMAGGLALLGVLVIAAVDRRAPRVFLLIGLGLAVWALTSRADGLTGVWTAVGRGSFVVALYTALSAIRVAAMGSPAILACGRFLAGQRPGLRYIALSLGGHLFGLILLYGSIALLGSLSAEAAAREGDADLRRARLRRMLLAVGRGFAATLSWSPLGFSMAITTALVPGARWGAVVGPGLVTAALMVLVGWALDSAFKPRLARPAPERSPPQGGWLANLRPLIVLMATVVVGVAFLHQVTGVEVIGAVMSLVPAIAIGWVWIQGRAATGAGWAHVASRVSEFVRRDLPGYGGQIVLLFMAAFIGSLGAFVLVPLMPALGLDLGAVPPMVLLIAMVWIVPLTGQLGMNPILSVSLMIPMLPSPEQMGIAPAALVAAITGGWAISAATSPFTASVLLVGSYADVSPRRVGLVWNGPYALIMGVIVSVWVAVLMRLL